MFAAEVGTFLIVFKFSEFACSLQAQESQHETHQKETEGEAEPDQITTEIPSMDYNYYYYFSNYHSVTGNALSTFRLHPVTYESVRTVCIENIKSLPAIHSLMSSTFLTILAVPEACFL